MDTALHCKGTILSTPEGVSQCLYGLFSRMKSEKGRWQALEHKFQAGPVSRDDAAAIMIELQSAMNTLSRPVSAGKAAENTDEYSILRGVYMKIAELIKEDMDKRSAE